MIHNTHIIYCKALQPYLTYRGSIYRGSTVLDIHEYKIILKL